jgi:hypothetical protein
VEADVEEGRDTTEEEEDLEEGRAALEVAAGPGSGRTAGLETNGSTV